MTLKSIAAIILVLVLLYGVVEALPLLRGPALSITSPTDYASIVDGYAHIEGVAKHTETLMLNGGPLLIDEQGRFSTALLLPAGGAILTLTAQDRFGRHVTETRTVLIP